jgi:thymidylate kinase|tara:strand:- start:227 stop:1006 length:780 start_codon:yes stop_codon:yes gene_type:complete
MKREGKGTFVVVDGLDGIGKGEIERALRSYEEVNGKAVFDSIAFSKANRKGLPELKDFWNPPKTYYDTIMTAEPSYAGIGHTIRSEIISNNGRDYSWVDQSQAYSLDRLTQMKRVVIPALENGLTVLQSRCMASTLTYQSLKANLEGKDEERIRSEILYQEGNRLQMENAPDLLIIPTIKDIDSLIKRIDSRRNNEKNDNCEFENVKFQEKLRPLYESYWLRDIFERYGTRVEYLDAGISVEESRNQAVEIYKNFLENR